MIPKIRVWVGRIGAKVARPATLAFWFLVMLVGLGAAAIGSLGASKPDAVLLQAQMAAAADRYGVAYSQLSPDSREFVGSILAATKLPPAEEPPPAPAPKSAEEKDWELRQITDARHWYVEMIWSGVALLFAGLAGIYSLPPQ
jgi:hypothetical protein